MFGNWFGPKKPTPPSAAKGPGAAKAKAPAAPRPRRVNLEKRYTIIAETGQGSMSHVYRAMDNQSGRTVCLKVQDREKTAAAVSRTTQADRPTEGAIGLLINHPNVVKTFEHGDSHKGGHFVVMEYIDGVTLTFVRESRGLSLPDKLELLAQAADGLAAVHKAGFIHRDVGPKNLLVDRDNRVKLIDFGLAVPNQPAFRRPGNRTGTRQYMAPELERREPTDERIDIFSFGVTAFEFLTGRLPFSGASNDPMAMLRLRTDTDQVDIAQVAPHLPGSLCDLVRKALARRPADRWPRMATLGAALRELPVAHA